MKRLSIFFRTWFLHVFLKVANEACCTDSSEQLSRTSAATKKNAVCVFPELDSSLPDMATADRH